MHTNFYRRQQGNEAFVFFASFRARLCSGSFRAWSWKKRVLLFLKVLASRGKFSAAYHDRFNALACRLAQGH